MTISDLNIWGFSLLWDLVQASIWGGAQCSRECLVCCFYDCKARANPLLLGLLQCVYILQDFAH